MNVPEYDHPNLHEWEYAREPITDESCIGYRDAQGQWQTVLLLRPRHHGDLRALMNHILMTHNATVK
jgi:hypothetical protein